MEENTPYKTALQRIQEAHQDESEILDLSGINLNAIPPEIKTLSKLKSLKVSHNQLLSLPEEIKYLRSLTSLIADKNRLTSIPSEIGNLINLQRLNLSHNKLQHLPTEVGKLEKLEFLYLRENNIKSIPKEFGNLDSLNVLDLDGNQLTAIPRELSQLKNLKTLDLYGNNINVFPFAIKEMLNLEKLYYGNNKLKEIPPKIANLVNLKELLLSGNSIRRLPVGIKDLPYLEILNLRGNPIAIPPEILEDIKNPQKICNYYFSLFPSDGVTLDELFVLDKSIFGKPLNQIKLLVIGQGSVGKTSLVQRLAFNQFNILELKTEGISINYWQVDNHLRTNSNESNIQLNIWDFGGQEIMHATHQFFLTKRSLYLLVLDSRLTQEENRVEYWLKIIQAFGGESPVLIIGNKTDQHPLDIDRTGLRKKYPNIVGIIETSAATGTGIEELKVAITEQVNNLPHVRDLLPENWFTVKAKLEKLGHDFNFITYDKYLDLCVENEINDETSQSTLIDFLHDLGIILHFQNDPRLGALGILNPQWVTNGVYKILNSHSLFQNKGVLTMPLLDEILNLPEYPRSKRLFIVDMMIKFELCYGIDGNSFLVPDLLPKDEPYTGEWNGSLAFKYAYSVLPSSIMSRLIVKMKDFIHQPSTWRSGTILKKNGNTGFIKADFEERTVIIKVDGTFNTRRDTLSLIRGAFEMIHKSISGLDVTQQVPHPQYPNLILDYEELIEFEREGVEDFPRKVDGKVIKVNVRELLNGVESETQRREKNVVNNNYYTASNGGFVIGGNFNGNVISGNNNKLIQDSYNKINSANLAPELSQTLNSLTEAIAVVTQAFPDEKTGKVMKNFERLIEESTQPEPDKQWYSVSVEGLIKAAENLDKLGEPVINLSQRVLSLLTGGLIK